MQSVHIKASTDYDVLIGEGLIDHSGELTARALRPCRCVLVSDDTVDELYGDRVQISFTYSGFDVLRFTFPAGEASKNMDTLGDLLEFMAENRVTRTDLVAALGGGVAGDMAGFAAAVYARGIRFIQIPTTLLAAVDSSVGGKTAVGSPPNSWPAARRRSSSTACSTTRTCSPSWRTGAGTATWTRW